MKVSKLLALVAMVIFSFFANAAEVDYTACKKAVELGKASWYTPSFVAKFTRVGDGEEIRAIEAPMCVHMSVVGGWKVVPLKTGTKLVFPKGENVPVRHASCNNPIKGGEYPGTLPVAQPAQSTVETTVVKETVVVKTRVLCKQSDGTTVEAENINGVAACPTVTVTAPVAVTAPAPAPMATAPCINCTPLRKTETGKGGWCRLDAGRTKLECNFEWKVLRTQDQVQNCGCQVFIPSTKQTVGFMDAMPGSPRCLQQKRLWADALGVNYSDSRYSSQ